MVLEKFLVLLAAVTPPELGPGPRPGLPPLPRLQAQLNDVLANAKLPGVRRDLLRGFVLLWHDELELSHQIAQGIRTADGCYLHGIMHRREPDYGNAKYWFRRVGRHPGFELLSGKAHGMLAAHPQLRNQLLGRGEWDPLAFIDTCKAAAELPTDDEQTVLLRRLQAEEFTVLLTLWCSQEPGV